MVLQPWASHFLPGASVSPIFKQEVILEKISNVPLSTVMHSFLELPLDSLLPPPPHPLTLHPSPGLPDTALQTATGPGQQLYHG